MHCQSDGSLGENELVRIENFVDIQKLQKIQDYFSGAVGIALVTVDITGKPIT